MPTWLIIILVVAVIGGIVGYFASDGEHRGSDAAAGAATAAFGCGHLLLQLLLWGLGLAFLICLNSANFQKFLTL